MKEQHVILTKAVVKDGIIHRSTYKTDSGRQTENGSFDYSINRQKLKDIGSIPKGEYHINPQEIQYTANRNKIDKVKGVFGGGTFRGGEKAWGIGRIWIKPQKKTIDGVARGNFSIHGGETLVSAECIDITSNDVHFFRQITSLGEIVQRYNS